MRKHHPSPGPMYWDFRCRICDGDVTDRSIHHPWWAFWR